MANQFEIKVCEDDAKTPTGFFIQEKELSSKNNLVGGIKSEGKEKLQTETYQTFSRIEDTKLEKEDRRNDICEKNENSTKRFSAKNQTSEDIENDKEKKYKCNLCTVTFTQSYTLQNHIKTIHTSIRI